VSSLASGNSMIHANKQRAEFTEGKGLSFVAELRIMRLLLHECKETMFDKK
jgi:hypothetical protein